MMYVPVISITALNLSTDPAEVLPPMLPNLHVLKLLRHYVTFCGTVEEVKDNGDCFTLTNGFNVDIQKDCKTTALIHR